MSTRTVPSQFFMHSSKFTPAYLNLGVAELRRRADEALEILRDCVACPRDCHVNRLDDKFAVCKTGRHAIVGSFFPHFGEEDCLRGWRGSGTIFFSMCNLRCAFCVSPDTRVLTEHGMQRIDEIFSAGINEINMNGGVIRLPRGIRAFTRNGTLAPIAKAFCHGYAGDAIVVKPVGLPPLTLTPNHRVFASTEPGSEPQIIAAAHLTHSHYLAVPKPQVSELSREIDVRTILEPLVGTFRKSPRRRVPVAALRELLAVRTRGVTYRSIHERYGHHPAYVRTLASRIHRGQIADEREVVNELTEEQGRIRFKTEKRPGIPSRILLDKRLARLLGYFCAEGHISTDRNRPNSHRLIFSFGRQEMSLAEQTGGLLRDLFGANAYIVQRHSTVTVEVGSASLALLFKSLCGTGAQEKRVPTQLFTAPLGVIRTFLNAYWQGDGCRVGDYLTANTVSQELALGLVGLLLRIGVFPYYYATTRSPTQVIDGRYVRQSETLYYVKFRHETWEGRKLVTPRSRETARVFWVPIRSISRIPYHGSVYNLEVADPDHSYVANGIGVGNCQNYDISQQGQGSVVTPEQLASMMLHLQDQGCHNINFVTPEHVVPQILEALPIAVDSGLRLQIVYNTSSYDSMHSLRLMDGIVDIYMPDFKYWDREMARHYMKAPDYPEVARRVITEMHRQVGPLKLDELGLAKRGLIIRHLVMPGGTAGTREIMQWISSELGADTYVNVMAQYYPAGQVGVNPKYEAINRKLLPDEFEDAVQAARDAGLSRLDVRIPRSPWLRWTPTTSAENDPGTTPSELQLDF